MHIHDVNLNALSRGPSLFLLTMRLLRASPAASLHISWNYPLHVEELLVVLTAFLVLHTSAARTTINLLLDTLHWMCPANSTTGSVASAARLRRGLVLPLQDLLLMMETTTVLVHVRAALYRVIGALLAALLSHDCLNLLRGAIAVLNEALICIAGSLLNSAFKDVPVLDVLDLFVVGTAWHDVLVLLLGSLLLVLAADSRPNIPNVTVLVVRVLLTSFLQLRLSSRLLVLLLLQCLLNELVFEDATDHHLLFVFNELCGLRL